MRILFYILVIICILSCSNRTKWYKGNTHTHTTYSDGDSEVSEVVKWYHDNGYNFLFVTDHNYQLHPDTIKMEYDVRSDFILIPGNEVSDINGVHTSALNTTEFFPTIRYYRTMVKNGTMTEEELQTKPISKSEILNMHVKAIRSKGALAVANHPNFISGLQVSDILPVEGIKHIELFNGHPQVYNWGNDIHSAVETKWDSLLITGRIYYGLASDDEHSLKKNDKEQANPGRGWIMVNAASLNTKDIMTAIESGNFYASTGVILKTYKVKNNTLSIEVDKKAVQKELKNKRGYARLDMDNLTIGCKIDFVGYNGKILQSTIGLKANYTSKPEDKYVRIRASYTLNNNNSKETYFAWTQPVEAEKGFFK